jgi:beta-glucosidase
LEATAARIRLLADRTAPQGNAPSVNHDAHHTLTRTAAGQSAVLLTNNGVLPLRDLSGKRVAVIGELARTTRYQGAGSSAVNPTRIVSALDALQQRLTAVGAVVTFAAGYPLEQDSPDQALETEAVQLAADSDLVIACLGLPSRFEAEGRDRTTIDLPANQLALITALEAVPAPTVVTLSNGSAVTTAAWKAGVDAILELWLTGQAHGDTLTDLLLGDVNPSGKLAETIPIRLADTPAFLNFPGENSVVRYGEGIFVGYRYYDAVDRNVDHPFGHGLSYTTFDYSNLQVSVNPLDDNVALVVTATLTNTGNLAGTEVVQVYLDETSPTAQTPPQQLRGFAKQHLQPGESATVTIPIAREDLGYYSLPANAWVFEGGDVGVRVGSSSRDIRLTTRITVPGHPVIVPLTVWSTLGEWFHHPTGGPAIKTLIEQRGGIKGRIADLLSDDIGRGSVLGVPLQGLLEFPGIPITPEDVVRVLTEI